MPGLSQPLRIDESRPDASASAGQAGHGTDNAVINDGGLQKDNDHDFTGGSTMTLNLGAYFRRNTTSTFGFTINGGSGLLINEGQFDANVAFFTVASTASYLEVVNGTFRFNAQSTSGFGINGGATVPQRTEIEIRLAHGTVCVGVKVTS